jgi:hypothetical protein
MPKSSKDPMHPQQRPPHWVRALIMARSSPRCRARARSGTQCRSPAMPNGCCRMHGGLSTGPRTREGLERLRAARTIHGGRGAEAFHFRQMLRTLRAETRRLAELV